jgi:hypothetical protein
MADDAGPRRFIIACFARKKKYRFASAGVDAQSVFLYSM